MSWTLGYPKYTRDVPAIDFMLSDGVTVSLIRETMCIGYFVNQLSVKHTTYNANIDDETCLELGIPWS